MSSGPIVGTASPALPGHLETYSLQSKVREAASYERLDAENDRGAWILFQNWLTC